MAIRRLMAVAPVVAALAIIAPVASASADTTPAQPAPTPASSIPCYPYPAFCSVDGTQLAPIPSWWPMAPKNQTLPQPPAGTPLTWNPWQQLPVLGFPSS